MPNLPDGAPVKVLWEDRLLEADGGAFHDVIPEPGVSGASNFLYSGYVDLKG